MANHRQIDNNWWSAEYLLHNRQNAYQTIREAFNNQELRQALNAQLVEGALIGRDVLLGREVVVERGAAILGASRILQGKVASEAVVIDCVVQKLSARPRSLLFQIEQLDEQEVVSRPKRLLADIIILDEEIICKVRINLPLDNTSVNETVESNGKNMTLDRLIALSQFSAPYLNGSGAQFRQSLAAQSLEEIFADPGIVARFGDNPILEPISTHPWESKMVYNPAAIRLEGTTYIVYRAFGDDHISRLGLAWSDDGLHIDGRLPHPIFSPQTTYELPDRALQNQRQREKGGCEDPRLTLIGDRVYMTYSAYANVLQIALASLAKEDFIALRHSTGADIATKWRRYGPLFPGRLDRNAVLFPEKIKGQYVLLHRPIIGNRRDIAITFADSLKAPWPDQYETIIQARADKWDSERVGAGTQVLKTRHGWLLIYHGVGIRRGRRSYMLGVALLDRDDPRRVLYRSPEPIFIPSKDYELYGWAPTVVFTNGATVRGKNANELAEDDDEILIYYGGGDRVIGVAWAKLKDILPLT